MTVYQVYYTYSIIPIGPIGMINITAMEDIIHFNTTGKLDLNTVMTTPDLNVVYTVYYTSVNEL